MSCSSSCTNPGSHKTYGECLRSKRVATTGLETTDPSFSTTRQKNWDKELNAYESAVRQGIQPEGTSMPKIQKAIEVSDKTGVAYRAEEH